MHFGNDDKPNCIIMFISLTPYCFNLTMNITQPAIDWKAAAASTVNVQADHLSGKPGNVREMSGMLLAVRELSGKKSCHGKVSQNWLLCT